MPFYITKRIYVNNCLGNICFFLKILAEFHPEPGTIFLDTFNFLHKIYKNQDKRGISMKKRRITGIITGFAVLFCFVSCTKGKLEKKGIITFTVGQVTLTDTTGKNKPAQITDTITPGMTLTTDARSEATIQVTGLGLLRVLQNSRVEITSLFATAGGSLINVRSGALFSKITKMKKGGRYRVKTPTALASVRGTEFLTRYDVAKKQATVALRSGKVEVTATEKAEKAAPAKNVTPGQVILISAAQTDIRKQTKVENLELEKLSLQPFIEKVKEKKAETIKDEMDSIKKEEEELDKKIEKAGDLSRLAPLDRLRAMGRPLTRLHLRDGSKLIGSVDSQNARVIRLNNGARVLTIPKKDIIRREPAR